MKVYIPKLVEGTDDHYKIYSEKRATMLCGDQLDEPFVKLHAVLNLLEQSEGDMDFLEFRIKSLLEEETK